MRHSFLIRTILFVALMAGGMPAQASYPPGVESGFRLLYEISFAEARSEFLAWEKANPQDPLGHAWEAASYLFFEELTREFPQSPLYARELALLNKSTSSPSAGDGDGSGSRLR
jgi:hypothetical protein